MLGNDAMETATTEVVSNRRRNDIEKSNWRTHRYFVGFKSWFHVEISTSNWCHNFHVDSLFKIDVISKNFPRANWKSNRWRIDEEVSIGLDIQCNVFIRKAFCTITNFHNKLEKESKLWHQKMHMSAKMCRIACLIVEPNSVM